MVTQKQLAEMLGRVNVRAVAEAANVSTKTIYRLRHQERSPNYSTVQKVLAGIKRIEGRAA
jgi:predicted transcriptional regulator